MNIDFRYGRQHLESQCVVVGNKCATVDGDTFIDGGPHLITLLRHRPIDIDSHDKDRAKGSSASLKELMLCCLHSLLFIVNEQRFRHEKRWICGFVRKVTE